jgi:hypothetical protein
MRRNRTGRCRLHHLRGEQGFVVPGARLGVTIRLHDDLGQLWRESVWPCRAQKKEVHVGRYLRIRLSQRDADEFAPRAMPGLKEEPLTVCSLGTRCLAPDIPKGDSRQV